MFRSGHYRKVSRKEASAQRLFHKLASFSKAMAISSEATTERSNCSALHGAGTVVKVGARSIASLEQIHPIAPVMPLDDDLCLNAIVCGAGLYFLKAENP
ncbi:MAG TPA: hypothetical protein VGO57_10310 [Verrucomicrobiae bacterium]|jgi:hypothetical protein